MPTDDPGWGGYVPPEDGGAGAPPGPETPPPRPSWWQSHRVLAVGGVVGALIVVVAAFALGNRPQPTPEPTVTATTTPGPSPTPTATTSAEPTATATKTGPANADFLVRADAICSHVVPKLRNDVGALQATGDTSALTAHFSGLITALGALGAPPVDDGSMATGLADWQQALDLLSPDNAQDFQINYVAGLHEFHALGLKVCAESAYSTG